MPGDTDGGGHRIWSRGDRVDVGNFDSDGLNVNDDWDDNRNDNVGLASSRKFLLRASAHSPVSGREPT